MNVILVILLSVLPITNPNRILNIYAKDKSDASYQEQMKIFAADPKGLKERDLVIKEHFGVSNFKITLTGKDGGEKYTSKSVLTLKKLYGIIDVMPMRKDEMKQ